MLILELVLQARLFAYPDAARYRLGVNYQQLPTNAAKVPVYCPFQRDGAMRFDDNYGADPNYVGSTLQPTRFKPEKSGATVRSLSVHTDHEKWVGEVSAYTSQTTEEDFVQPAALWEVLGREPGHQDRVIDNLAGSISGVQLPELRDSVYGSFTLRIFPLLVILQILTTQQHSFVVSIMNLELNFERRPKPWFKTR